MCKENLSQLAGLMVTLLFVTTGLSYAQTVTESGDAGDVPGSAQDASGIPITRITGEIPPASYWDKFNRDVDMYKITINDPAAFSATTFDNETDFNTYLFLFDSDGKAVYMHDDVPKPGSITPHLQSTLPAGHALGPTTAGDYYLAVTGYICLPFDEDGNRVFEDGLGRTVVHGPSLSNKPVVHWQSPVYATFHSGPYEIDLTGVGPIGPVLFDVTAMSQVDKSGMRFDRRTGLFSVMATWTNISAEQFFQPLQMVIEGISSPSVTVANVDGTTSDGKPYFDYSSLVGDGNLDPGETSEAKPLMFTNPTRIRFTFDVSCWASLDNGGPG